MLNITQSIYAVTHNTTLQLTSDSAPSTSTADLNEFIKIAFHLAYFIHPDKAVATQVTTSAFDLVTGSGVREVKTSSRPRTMPASKSAWLENA